VAMTHTYTHTDRERGAKDLYLGACAVFVVALGHGCERGGGEEEKGYPGGL
jgi:hypothetical protein